MDSDVIKNIDRGFLYFTDWLNFILQKGMPLFVIKLSFSTFLTYTDPKFPHTSSTQKLFLSWQSKYTFLNQWRTQDETFDKYNPPPIIYTKYLKKKQPFQLLNICASPLGNSWIHPW